MRVIEIVKAHLVANGYDGLVCPPAECGCQVSELQPCGEDFSCCQPAYKRMLPDGDWEMHTKKQESGGPRNE